MEACMTTEKDTAPLGSTLEVNPNDIENYFNRVLETGEALLQCLQKEATS